MMGERALKHEDATADDLARMAKVVSGRRPVMRYGDTTPSTVIGSNLVTAGATQPAPLHAADREVL